MKRSLILTVLSFLMLAQLSLAQMPQTISYQGVLRHSDGTLVPAAGGDTTATITFSLYDVATPTTPVWTETQSVLVSDGLFSVILGKVTTLSNLTAPPVELGIKVGADVELSPRIELTSVLYSMNAQAVKGPDNVFPGSGSVGIGTGATAPSAMLDVAGNVKADGLQLATATERWYAIPHVEFDALNRTMEYSFQAMVSMLVNVFAPVHLPHGSTISTLQAVVRDTTTGNMTVVLEKVNTSGVLTEIDSVKSTAIAIVHPISTTLSGSPEIVDNQNNIYIIQAKWRTPDLDGIYSPQDIRLYSVRIKYTVTMPLP